MAPCMRLSGIELLVTESVPFDHTCIESSASSLPAVWIFLFLRCVGGAVWIQMVDPSITTLYIRSTRNHRSYCDPIVTMFLLHCFDQLCVFFWLPSAATRITISRTLHNDEVLRWKGVRWLYVRAASRLVNNLQHRFM
jgi:hypothetical protein